MVKKEKIAIPPKLDSERPPSVLDEVKNIRCYDLRNEQPDPPQLAEQKHRIIKGRVVKRDPSTITTVVIHQTACVFGASQAAINAAGGDRELAIARRSLNVAAHGVSFEGFYALPNPLLWYVWHANALNEPSLGLEIEGTFPGLMDDPTTAAREDIASTWGGKPMRMSELRVEAARACLKHMVDEARKLGCPIEWIKAHRQSSATRRSDPGQEPWERVVLEYATKELGLKTDTKYVIGDGRMIPKSWDPDGMGSY